MLRWFVYWVFKINSTEGCLTVLRGMKGNVGGKLTLFFHWKFQNVVWSFRVKFYQNRNFPTEFSFGREQFDTKVLQLEVRHREIPESGWQEPHTGVGSVHPKGIWSWTADCPEPRNMKNLISAWPCPALNLPGSNSWRAGIEPSSLQLCQSLRTPLVPETPKWSLQNRNPWSFPVGKALSNWAMLQAGLRRMNFRNLSENLFKGRRWILKGLWNHCCSSGCVLIPPQQHLAQQHLLTWLQLLFCSSQPAPSLPSSPHLHPHLSFGVSFSAVILGSNVCTPKLLLCEVRNLQCSRCTLCARLS